MAMLVPPPAPPPVATTDNDDTRRFRTRLFQVAATLVTLLATAWVCTLGIVAAIIALSIAKHVLVAILMMGIGVDAPKEP